MVNTKNKNIVILYVFLVIISMCFVSANGVCIPNWLCTDWSECIGATQMRSCIDANSCENNTVRPSESQLCGSLCDPNWDCTDWEPENCPKNKIQERICNDLNNCESKRRPAETKLCTYEPIFSWFFIIIVGMIILMIIVDFIVIIKLFKKDKSQIDAEIKRLKYPGSSKPL